MRVTMALALAATMMGCGAAPRMKAQPVERVASAAEPVQVTTAAPAEVAEPPAKAKEARPVEATRMPDHKLHHKLPTDCASHDGELCLPPAEFVKQLCRSSRPDAALALFRKGTPWTRVYLRHDLEAWYVPGRHAVPKQLKYAEEVLVMAHRGGGGGGGVSISGMASYDVLRWDGSCVSVMTDEVSRRPPATPDVATIDWKRLDRRIKSALEQREAISFRNRLRLDSCRGASGSDRCLMAIEDLSRVVASHVREGRAFPVPTELR